MVTLLEQTVTGARSHERPNGAGGPQDESGARWPEHLRIVAWVDPVIDAVGHDPRSWYVEHFWLPVLGPTSTWFMRRAVAGLDLATAGVVVDSQACAQALGLGRRQGRNSPFARAVGRCVAMETARFTDPETLAVRRVLPTLPRRHLLRLPPNLQRLHDGWAHAQRRTPELLRQQARARRLALGLVACQRPELATTTTSRDTLCVELMRMGVHPSLADAAVAWAAAWEDQEPRSDT